MSNGFVSDWGTKVGAPDPLRALARQEGGTHYKDMPIQPVEYIHRNGIWYLAGNVIKYASRYRAKGGADDIRKAIHYCQLILALEFGDRDEEG